MVSLKQSSNSQSVANLLAPVALILSIVIVSADPLARRCGPTTANITCIHRYGSLLPGSYTHDPDPTKGYTTTKIDDDPSWAQVATADIVVYDEQRALKILGSAPRVLHKYIPVLDVIHEAPIYHPASNRLIVTQDGPPGNLSNLVIDLNHEPPKVDFFTTDPPIYQPTGGILHDDYIYWTVQGNNDSLPQGLRQKPGVVRVDPVTFKAEWLLNSFWGFPFGGPNDLAIAKNGDIYFTDSDYAYALGLSPTQNQLALATYRFRPSTGEISVADNSLQRPNGVAFALDGKTLYVGDSGFEYSDSKDPANDYGFYNYPVKVKFTSSNARNVYAFGVADTDTGALLYNKRVLWQSLEGAPDGLKVAANGYLLVCGGLSSGLDIIDNFGHQILRIQTKHAVQNVNFAGKDLKTIFLTGIGGITKVEMDLPGPDPNHYYRS